MADETPQQTWFRHSALGRAFAQLEGKLGRNGEDNRTLVIQPLDGKGAGATRIPLEVEDSAGNRATNPDLAQLVEDHPELAQVVPSEHQPEQPAATPAEQPSQSQEAPGY